MSYDERQDADPQRYSRTLPRRTDFDCAKCRALTKE